ncbi:MAG: glycoside hydrolase family 2 protein [Bacteroidetes bacterium]|nr:glycoside hydrolase family 2 protein [Bacteroidota bacterium]
MRPALIAALGLCAGSLAAQVVHRPLDGDWRFQRVGEQGWHPAVVPGVVHTDLLRAGLIPDPYRDFNVDSVQWIENEEWAYERTIDADEALLAHAHVDLVFKGLDTFAEVHWNDSLLGRTDNMFRTWEFPVKDLLRRGPNTLRVLFRSPIAEGRKRRDAYGIQLPHDSDPSGVSPYIRKAAYQFGWDFCPRLVTSGIWQPVELRCWDAGRIRDVAVRQDPDTIGATVAVDVSTDIGPVGSRVLRIAFADTVSNAYPDGGEGGGSAHFRLRHPRRWWPSGAGEQYLHPLRVELLCDGRVVDTWEAKIGLRSVELDQRADSIGTAFTFRVNGVPLFMKGCNLVPPSMFLPEAGDSAWIALVRHMQRAHMNMVRVWAGGVYPPDAFFEACDTAGILVWQDLMLANMPPGDPAFQQGLEQEVREQGRRLERHPSLALWCGNNELDVAWKNWGWQATYHITPADSAVIAAAYRATFNDHLPSSLPAQVPYVPTSPLSNWGHAEGLRHGDLHYWGVWHGDSTFASFARNVGRFVSEYGFQSYPDSSLLARYITPERLYLGSPALRYRQRSYRTDRPILEAVQRELGLVPGTLGAFIAAGQAVQARACRLAITAHLAARPRCMGTLVWQLNDPWPGPSWSLVDQGGRWKPAMEEVQRLYGGVR